MIDDGVHASPNDPDNPVSDSGEHRIAVAFAAALEAEGICVPGGTDSSFPLTDILVPTSTDSENLDSPISLLGQAIDTGGSGFDRVEVGIQNSNGDWLNFANGSFTSSVQSINAHLFQTSTNHTMWRVGFGDSGPSGPMVSLPTGDYTLFALATDNDGNQNFFGSPGPGQWPEQIQFSVQNDGGTTGGGGSGGSLFQEAEDGELSGDMEVVNDSDVSGGQFVRVPVNVTGNSNTDFVEFTVSIETAGSYQVRAGVRGPTGSQNSFFAQINDGDVYLWDIPRDNELTEVLLSDRGSGDVTEILSVGVHTLRVSVREEGSQLDWIEFELK